MSAERREVPIHREAGLKYLLNDRLGRKADDGIEITFCDAPHVCGPCFGGCPRHGRNRICRVLLCDAGKLPESFYLEWTRAGGSLSTRRQEWLLSRLPL